MDATVEEFLRALQVVPAGDDRFRVTAPDWGDGDRLFGGVVVAHTLNAALQTVDSSRVRPHSLHGCFLLPVRPGADLELRVERWRNGRSFATRHVTLLQDGRRAMAATVSFHVHESGDRYQLPMDTDVPAPEDLPVGEWGGPLDAREAGPIRSVDGTYRSTRRVWLRLPRQLPDTPVLHATVAAYISDMTGNSFRPLSLTTWGRHIDASLDHAIWLHRPFRVDEWLFYDLQAVVNAGGRGLVRGSLYDRSGQLCLSLAQELLIRPVT